MEERWFTSVNIYKFVLWDQLDEITDLLDVIVVESVEKGHLL